MVIMNGIFETTPEIFYSITKSLVARLRPSLLLPHEFNLETAPLFEAISVPVMTKCGPSMAESLRETRDDAKKKWYIVLEGNRIGCIWLEQRHPSRSVVKIETIQNAEENPLAVSFMRQLANGIKLVLTVPQQTASYVAVSTILDTRVHIPGQSGRTEKDRRDAYGIGAGTKSKIENLRKKRREEIRERGIIRGRAKLCNEIGIDSKTVRKHAPELWMNWEDKKYDLKE